MTDLLLNAPDDTTICTASSVCEMKEQFCNSRNAELSIHFVCAKRLLRALQTLHKPPSNEVALE